MPLESILSRAPRSRQRWLYPTRLVATRAEDQASSQQLLLPTYFSSVNHPKRTRRNTSSHEDQGPSRYLQNMMPLPAVYLQERNAMPTIPEIYNIYPPPLPQRLMPNTAHLYTHCSRTRILVPRLVRNLNSPPIVNYEIPPARLWASSIKCLRSSAIVVGYKCKKKLYHT